MDDRFGLLAGELSGGWRVNEFIETRLGSVGFAFTNGSLRRLLVILLVLSLGQVPLQSAFAGYGGPYDRSTGVDHETHVTGALDVDHAAAQPDNTHNHHHSSHGCAKDTCALNQCSFCAASLPAGISQPGTFYSASVFVTPVDRLMSLYPHPVFRPPRV